MGMIDEAKQLRLYSWNQWLCCYYFMELMFYWCFQENTDKHYYYYSIVFHLLIGCLNVSSIFLKLIIPKINFLLFGNCGFFRSFCMHLLSLLPKGPQESKEEDSRGSQLQRVFHVWAGSDPGIQRGRIWQENSKFTNQPFRGEVVHKYDSWSSSVAKRYPSSQQYTG